MIDILPEVCLIKILTYLNSESLNNFLVYFQMHDKENFQKLKLRINKSIRAMYPFLQSVEKAHCFLDTINTKARFIHVYSSIYDHLRASYKPNLSRVLYKNTCYDIIVRKLVDKKALTQKQTKTFLDVVNYNNSPIIDYSIKKFKVKLDGKSCLVDVSLLDDYLSLGISYSQNPLHDSASHQNPVLPQALSV